MDLCGECLRRGRSHKQKGIERMYGNRFCAVIGALLIVITTAACLPETKALLSDPSSAKMDQRLLGD